jgi:hypothetical protein
VPLDKCVALAKGGMFGRDAGAGAATAATLAARPAPPPFHPPTSPLLPPGLLLPPSPLTRPSPHPPPPTPHPPSHPPGAADPHHRREALSFLHVCLASVLNLRSPADSELPGTPLDKLTEMLLGSQPPPHVLPTQSRVGRRATGAFGRLMEGAGGLPGRRPP